MSDIKQVIIIRVDLKMKAGKVASQVAHASMGALFSLGKKPDFKINMAGLVVPYYCFRSNEDIDYWLDNTFTKICLKVDSEEELLNLRDKAKEMGLIHALITDNGLTVFGGVPTNTTLAIGPAKSEVLDSITRHLKLY